ncbi:MAG: glycosyltransferase [Gemmatimonadota bacterium]
MKEHTPAVSVVMPTFNRLGLLEQAVESVLNQTFTDLELLVVDDGSTDGTLAYLESIEDPRLRAISLPHSGNIAAARNGGATQARGNYLAFLDSDDLWLPDKLKLQLACSARAGVRWSYTRYDYIDENGRSVPGRAGKWRPLSGNIANKMVAAEASVTICSVLVDRALFEQVGRFDNDLTRRNDYELLVRLSLAAETVAVEESLVRVREHSGRVTRGMSGADPFLATARAYEKLLRIIEDPDLRRVARRRRAHHLAEAGSHYLRANSIRPAARCFVQSVLDDPQPRQLASALYRGLKNRRRMPWSP